MRKKTATQDAVESHLAEYGIEFGEKYRDPSSNFEGTATALYFYRHGCLRVGLRGMNKTTGEPAEFTFDAPELIKVATEEPVPVGTRRGGPHGMTGPSRTGI